MVLSDTILACLADMRERSALGELKARPEAKSDLRGEIRKKTKEVHDLEDLILALRILDGHIADPWADPKGRSTSRIL